MAQQAVTSRTLTDPLLLAGGKAFYRVLTRRHSFHFAAPLGLARTLRRLSGMAIQAEQGRILTLCGLARGEPAQQEERLKEHLRCLVLARCCVCSEDGDGLCFSL